MSKKVGIRIIFAILIVIALSLLYVLYEGVGIIWNNLDAAVWKYAFLLLVVISILGPLALIGYLASRVFKGQSQMSRDNILRSTGIRASAVIKEIKRGGRYIGSKGAPAVIVYVRVNGGGNTTFDAQVETIMDLVLMSSRFQPGSEVEVAYDPAEPQKVAMITPTR